MVVRSLFLHDGAPADLVKRLKYGAVAQVATLVAPLIAARLPPAAEALVPIPRTTTRRVRYGIDPARQLATAVSRHSGLPTVGCLIPPFFAPRHAGRRRSDRPPIRFRSAGPVPADLVLIDDVITTGLTLLSASQALGGLGRWAVTVTAAAEVTSLSSQRSGAGTRPQWNPWTFS
jgi:predicted amidophosphoribosyltransferase